MNQLVADIFFLNIEDAYREAAKQQPVLGDDGQERLQYCYYDGPLTDIVLPNFIQVEADRFVDFFSHNHLPVPQRIALSQNGCVELNEMPADVLEEIQQYRSAYKVPSYIHVDTYFLDPLFALNVAKQRNRVACGHPTIDGLQICYYRGELPVHQLENLIHLELPEFENFFVRSRLRMPQNVQMPDELEADVQSDVKRSVVNAMETVKRNRTALMQSLLNKAIAARPSPVDERPRIFIPSSRLTTVMQYSSQGMANAFAELGWAVRFYIEANDMEGSNMVDMLEQYIEFDPHACFYVNCLNNNFMHDDVVNIVWWQDLMPQLKNREPLKWRKRDFNFSISPQFDHYLEQCQAKSVQRLHFVIDDAVFHNKNAEQRSHRVVFVGSSYRPVVNLSDSQHQQALEGLTAMMEQGATFDEAGVAKIAEAAGLSYDFVFWRLLHYVIRDESLHWLCTADLDLPVDVYGRYWDQDEVVAPFFRGELVHGEAVAEVYRTARYALVCHPFEINSQRLAEVAACGCIPVVYDCRDVAEAPHWDEHCLFFKTAADLADILTRRLRPAKAPEALAEQFTYRAAAKRVIATTALSQLVGSGLPSSVVTASLLPNHCIDQLRLTCDDPASLSACQDRLQTNLASLQQHRPELYAMLQDAWSAQCLSITLSRSINGYYWRVTVVAEGEELYRLDNLAWLEHQRMITENATAMTRENTCCYALVGMGAGYELLAAFNATALPITEMAEFEVPIYLIESVPQVWLLNLLLHDLSALISARRLQIYHSNAIEPELASEFAKFEAALPDVLFELNPQPSLNAASLYQLTLTAKESRAERHLANLQEVADYYAGITTEQWRQKFSPERVGELRVMGFISRFSSFLKYCMRDWLDGFGRLGASVKLCTEGKNYYLTNIEQVVNDINSFKPDMILTIDHFRHEYPEIPVNLPFVNWIQDMLPNITGNQTAITERDFTFVFSKHWLAMNDNELYQNFPMAYLPVGFNDRYYYPLAAADYDYDFLVISHLIAPEKTFQPFRMLEACSWQYDDNEWLLLRNGDLTEQQIHAIYRILVDYTDLLTLNQFHAFCIDNQGGSFSLIWQLLKDHDLDIDQQQLNNLMAGACTRFHYNYLTVMKIRPIQILINSGLDLRVALYGKNWEKYPEFLKYAKGIAENGQHINQLMNSSKICFNGSPGTTLHMRALEIMASGSFILSKRIYNDAAPLSEYYTEGEVAYYEDEADLVEKIRFYLDNELIRRSMAEKAYLKTVDLFSYKVVANSVLNSVVHRFGKEV